MLVGCPGRKSRGSRVLGQMGREQRGRRLSGAGRLKLEETCAKDEATPGLLNQNLCRGGLGTRDADPSPTPRMLVLREAWGKPFSRHSCSGRSDGVPAHSSRFPGQKAGPTGPRLRCNLCASPGLQTQTPDPAKSSARCPPARGLQESQAPCWALRSKVTVPTEPVTTLHSRRVHQRLGLFSRPFSRTPALIPAPGDLRGSLTPRSTQQAGPVRLIPGVSSLRAPSLTPPF